MLEGYTSDQNKCENKSEIFDGKRRFQMSFNHQDNVGLDSSKYNIFKGQAAECIIEVKPGEGAWHKKPRGWLSIQEQGREKGTMPTLWVGQPESSDIAIPVKIRVKTDYGTLFMHLAGVK